jgi:glycerol-3-phosphate acyltransferase PlsX
MRVALDAMGGDHAPEATVAGAVLAARELGARVWLVGHQDVLRARLERYAAGNLPIVLHHAPDVIGMDEPPVAAVRRKPRCSLRVTLDLLRAGTVDAVVSAGNSGAVLAGALFTVGPLAEVDRPAIAVPLPAAHGPAILVDAGASVDAGPLHLVQFAVMGEAYARALGGPARPRVAVLSNGQEPGKGTETTREASRILRTVPIEFIGYVEGRDLPRDVADVVVCDGFVGNAVLKAVEGFGMAASDLLREAFRSTWRGRLGYVLARGALERFRRRLDYAEYGGAPLLGVDGVVIIAHGSSGPVAIRNAIRVAHDSVRLGVNAKIVGALRALPPLETTAGQRRRRLWAQLRGRLSTSRDGRDAPADDPSRRDEQTPRR